MYCRYILFVQQTLFVECSIAFGSTPSFFFLFKSTSINLQWFLIQLWYKFSSVVYTLSCCGFFYFFISFYIRIHWLIITTFSIDDNVIITNKSTPTKFLSRICLFVVFLFSVLVFCIHSSNLIFKSFPKKFWQFLIISCW